MSRLRTAIRHFPGSRQQLQELVSLLRAAAGAVGVLHMLSQEGRVDRQVQDHLHEAVHETIKAFFGSDFDPAEISDELYFGQEIRLQNERPKKRESASTQKPSRRG